MKKLLKVLGVAMLLIIIAVIISAIGVWLSKAFPIVSWIITIGIVLILAYNIVGRE